MESYEIRTMRAMAWGKSQRGDKVYDAYLL